MRASGAVARALAPKQVAGIDSGPITRVSGAGSCPNNDEATRVHTFDDWLNRDAGDKTLCERCSNNTGSWYGNELARAARSAGGILAELDLKKLDASLVPAYATVRFKQSAARPYPLRLIQFSGPDGVCDRASTRPPNTREVLVEDRASK